ncbi:MAG: hypothetical protein Q9218_001587 [Villophora microphyllina]
MPKSRKPLKRLTAKVRRLACLDPQQEANSVFLRVRNCLTRADHENSNEHEARLALKMAHKIMEQHNIQLADVMANEQRTQRAKLGDMSVVYLVPAAQGGRIRWTFYGIAEHTSSAAISFEAVYNQIQDWSENRIGVTQRLSYALGVADGLVSLADEERSNTENTARQNEANAFAATIRKEAIEQQRKRERLRSPSPDEDLPTTADTVHILTVDGKGMNVDMEADDEDDTKGLDNNFRSMECRPKSKPDEALLYQEEQSLGIPDHTKREPDCDTEQSVTIKLEPSDSSREHTPEKDSRTTIGPERSVSPSDHSPEPPPCLNVDSILPDTVPTSEGTVLPGVGTAAPEASQTESTTGFPSIGRLEVFRGQSEDVANDVLKKNNITIRKGRKRKATKMNRDAWRQGKEDSRKIEVRAARIEPKVHDDDANKMDTDP